MMVVEEQMRELIGNPAFAKNAQLAIDPSLCLAGGAVCSPQKDVACIALLRRVLRKGHGGFCVGFSDEVVQLEPSMIISSCLGRAVC